MRKKVRLGNREGKVIIMSVEQDSLVTRKEENISLGGGGSSGAKDVGSMGDRVLCLSLEDEKWPQQ